MDWRFKISIGFMLLLIASALMLGSDTPIIDPLLNFFLYSIPSNAAISILPHEPVLIFLGKTHAPLLLAIIASLGTLIAGVLDFYVYVPLLSHNSIQSVRNTKNFVKVTKWFSRQPFFSLVIAGMTPLPFFPFKIIAFSTNYPLLKYLSALLLGRFPRYYFLAYLGDIIHIPNWITLSMFVLMFSYIILTTLPNLRKFKTSKSLENHPKIEEVSNG